MAIAVVIAVAGLPQGASFAVWSLHLGGNALGAFSSAVSHIGTWINEGRDAVHVAPPAGATSDTTGTTTGGH